MAQKDEQLATESVGKLLLKLSIPTITAQLVNALYNMVDRMYIGHIEGIGANALTGIGLTMPIIMLISACAYLFCIGGAPRASIMMGRGKPEEAEKILGSCTLGTIVAAIILTVLFLIFGERFLWMFGASENTLPYAMSYMQIYVCGTIFVQLALGLNAFITAQGFTRISMLSVLIGAVCNIVLDPLFIFVFQMGVSGAAIATVISQGISAVWVVSFLMGRRAHIRLRLSNLRMRWRIYLPCIALGLSPFVMQSTESLLNICFNSSLYKYGGDLAVGAMAILSSVMQLISLPMSGITQGAQPIISYNYGARNAERVRKAFTLVLISCISYSLLIAGSAVFFPRIYVMLFASDEQMIEYASWALRIYLMGMTIFGAQNACQQTFIALGDAKTSLFLAILRKIILLIPLIYILPNFFDDKVFAVFLAEPVADVLAVCTTVTVFLLKFKKTMARMNSAV